MLKVKRNLLEKPSGPLKFKLVKCLINEPLRVVEKSSQLDIKSQN